MAKLSSVRRSFPIAEVIEHRVLLSGSHVPVGMPAVPLADAQDGVSATWYYGTSLKKQDFTETEANIDLDCRTNDPAPSLIGKSFSIEWTGQIIPQYSETYTFRTLADDGIKVWVGGQLIINNWQQQWPTARAGKISLQAGDSYDITVEYFANSHPPSVAEMYWKSASQSLEIVPSSALRTGSVGTPTLGAEPTDSTPAAPTTLTATAASNRQVDLSWTGVSGAGGYVIERSADGNTGWGTVTVVGGSQTQYADTGLSGGRTYYYRILTTGATGTSGPSNTASATTAADPYVYALTNSGTLDQIDTATASTTEIGTLLFGTAAGDRDPITGNFYYLDQNTSTPRVAMYNPATQTNTLLSTVSLSGSVMRAAFNAQGVLYITAGNGDLYTIDTMTGAATFIGTITANGAPLPAPSGDMAFAPNGTLYLDDNSAMYTVDLTSLTATYIGDNGNLGNVQIGFGSDGTLYGTVGTGQVYTINLTTGAGTLIGNTGVANIGDLASAPM